MGEETQFGSGPRARAEPETARVAGEASTSALSCRVRESLPPHLCGSDHNTWQRINNILETGSCGLVVCDALEVDHPIIYVDTQYQKITGYHATEVLGKNCRFMQFRGLYATGRHQDVDTNAIAAMRTAIDKGEECEVQLLNFMRGGQPIWNRIQILPIFGDPRQPALVTHFAGLLDVTDIHASYGPLPHQHCDPSVSWAPICGTQQQGSRQELRMTAQTGHIPYLPR
ncbi:uncharacterized protein LOC142356778, partial [Convolutriloba macropyga]|uniref:uncharacterized protein LOC142356778 n=1 Tax=Convolutriloba macropyga TaxID=536237 RepID=UPI003F51F0C4